MQAVIHEVVEVVKHRVLVEEHLVVEVDVIFVMQAVSHVVVEVVRHNVLVDEHLEVEVEL